MSQHSCHSAWLVVVWQEGHRSLFTLVKRAGETAVQQIGPTW